MPCPPSGWGPSDCQGPQGFGTASLHMGNPLGQNCSFSISFLKHTWQHLGPHSLSSPRAVWPVCQAQPWPFLVGLSGCWLTSTLAVTPQTGTIRPFVAWQPLLLATLRRVTVTPPENGRRTGLRCGALFLGNQGVLSRGVSERSHPHLQGT